MKTQMHQVTGLGPVKADGSVDLFTILPQPFHVSAEWLKENGMPAVGDELVENENVELVLIQADFNKPVEPQPEEPQPVEEPPVDDQKKTDTNPADTGLAVSSTKIEPIVPNLYRANPVEVVAYQIIGVAKDAASSGLLIYLQDQEPVVATPDMLARFIPSEGDYWVVQADGYEYLNPKEVFERKYSPVTE